MRQVACYSPGIVFRKATERFLSAPIMGTAGSTTLALSLVGPDRPANIFGSMPARLLIDDDSRRLVAEASPRPPSS